MTPKTIESALADAANRLAGSSDSPRLDAETLLACVLDAPRSHLFAHPEEQLAGKVSKEFEAAITRRSAGEPAAYITGSKEFWSLQLKVTTDTLIPRPETELLVEQALLRIPEDQDIRLLDLGTGSGAIAIAIASERTRSKIDAIDSNRDALTVAKENAAQNSLTNVSFLHGDWIEPVQDECFDVIVSNPPYVRDDDPVLDDLRFEPQSALTAGPDGLDAVRRIANDAKSVMATSGTLLLEHGAEQQDAVAAILREYGWTDIECFKDLAGHPRVTAARMGNPSLQDQP
jgi:release factor glutamine methyltransferase